LCVLSKKCTAFVFYVQKLGLKFVQNRENEKITGCFVVTKEKNRKFSKNSLQTASFVVKYLSVALTTGKNASAGNGYKRQSRSHPPSLRLTKYFIEVNENVTQRRKEADY
jgi:hypothetical protein